MRTSFLHSTMLLLLALSTGCASMYNPLTPGFREDQHPILRDCAFPPDYQSGVKCAQKVQEKYLEAATDDATMSDRFFVAMIPISLAAVGVGIASGSGNAITGLALASATGLGWGTVLTSKTRRELYGLGAQAINCVITASSPLDIPNERLVAAKNHGKDVRTALSGFSAALDEFSREIANETKKPNGGVSKKLTELGDLEGAKKLEAQAKDSLGSASVTIAALDKAGRTVWDATMDVHTQVVTAQVKNSNDLHDFSNHLQGSVYGSFQDVIGLAGIPNQFKMKPADKNQIQRAAEPSDAQKQLVTNLLNTANHMKASMLTLEDDLRSIDVADLNSQFAACMNPIKQFQPAKALRIRPSTLVNLKPGAGSVPIRISGGTPPYTITPAWQSSIDLKTEGPPDSGPAIVTITAEGKVPAGTYRLSVEDSAQNAVIVRIMVSESADETTPTASSGQPAQAEDKNIVEAKKSIRDALNGSVAVKRSAWKNVGDQDWENSDTTSDGDLRFDLEFKTEQDATNAAGTAPQVSKLQTLNSNTTALSVTPNGQLLVVIIPKAKITELVKAIGDKQWPEK